jgi:hypothetical protein
MVVNSHRAAASLEKRGCEGTKGGWVRRREGGGKEEGRRRDRSRESNAIT